MEFGEAAGDAHPTTPPAHRRSSHGVLAPNAPLRALVTARAGLPMDESFAVIPHQALVKRDEEAGRRSRSTPGLTADSRVLTDVHL